MMSSLRRMSAFKDIAFNQIRKCSWMAGIPYDRNVLSKDVLSGYFKTTGTVKAIKEKLEEQVLDLVVTTSMTSKIELLGTTVDFGRTYQEIQFVPSSEEGNHQVMLKELVSVQVIPTWIIGIPVHSEGQSTEELTVLAICKKEVAWMTYNADERQSLTEALRDISGNLDRKMLLDILMMKEEKKLLPSSNLTAWFRKNQKPL